MPTFVFKAQTPSGEERTGVVESASKEGALDILQRQSLFVTSLAEQKNSFRGVNLRIGGWVSTKDIVIFSRELSVLFDARIPILVALETLEQEVHKKTLKEAIREIIEDVRGGFVLSQAMTKHPNVFSTFYIGMVRSGEESGKLQEVFSYLADYLERTYELTNRAKHALMYPALIILAFIGVVVVMLTVVVPQLIPIFENLGEEPPLFARVMFTASILIRQWALLLLLSVFALVFGILRYAKTPPGQYFFSRVQISLPLIGNLYRKFYVARITDNLRTLIEGGIPILQALRVTADVTTNLIYRDAVLSSIESVKGGSTISDAFERSPEIPTLTTQMIRIGEATGNLDVILDKLANFYRKDVESIIENLVTLIEPFLILLIGGGVGFFVFSILGPIYNMVGSF